MSVPAGPAAVIYRQRLLQAGHRVPDAAVDGALGAVFLVIMLVERAAATPAITAPAPVTIALSVVIAAGLALRRRAPLLGYVLGSAALAAEALFVQVSPVSPYANVIGIYSLGLHPSRARAWWGPVVVIPGVLGYFAGQAPQPLVTPVGVVLTWLLAWALGYSTARRREAHRAARRLVREQTVAEERARIARELHDLIGHTVNVMVVQAGAARLVLDRNPEQARELLSSVEGTGRDALAELDRVLGVLRRDRPALATQPGGSPAKLNAPTGLNEPDIDAPDIDAPGLDDLPKLLERTAQAGLSVSLTVEVDTSLPPSLDLSAYRIIQEALTNALRHGQARSAWAGVREVGRAIEVEVRDFGSGAAPDYLPGRGLLGIRDRAALFGGTVEHGTVGDGVVGLSGFRIRALLPLP